MKQYVTFDEIENVLSSLDMLAAIAPLAKRRITLWKWIIVGAQDALQGAIVCAIADSTNTNILREDSAKKMLSWFEDTSKKYPGEYMADFKSLLKRAAISMSAAQAKDVNKLYLFRNEFAHFTPKSWALEIGGLPRIIGVALQLVEQLMQNDRVEYQMTGSKKRRIKTDIKAIRVALDIV